MKRFCCSLSATLAVLALIAFSGPARAGEFIDGNTPPTVRNNMHVCPRGAIVTGVHVTNNQLLCLSQFADVGGFLTTNETVVSGLQWPPDAVTRAAHGFSGTAIPWCGPDRYVTGVHVANRSFSCSEFPAASNINFTKRLGHIVVDGATQRSGMHACPRGSVLVGANFDTNTFLCAELPFCVENSHCPGSLAGEVCEFRSTGCATDDCIGPTTGVCRRQGSLTFLEDPNCADDSDGWLTDRSRNAVRFPDFDSFDNDDAESLRMTNVRAGAIIRVFDSPDGATSDDWTQIFVKSTGTGCLGSFESNFENSFVKVQYQRANGLNDHVSRVEVRSAILDFAGRCVDVNMNNNVAQLFTCHAGPNQSWTYEVTGEIRGINNLCLEASSAQIHTWPNLAPGQPRRASVRVAACNGSVHQKWSVTEAGQLRMFNDMCLDIPNGTSVNGRELQIYPCNGGQNQRWTSTF
jgi:hypothetical protein